MERYVDRYKLIGFTGDHCILVIIDGDIYNTFTKWRDMLIGFTGQQTLMISLTYIETLSYGTDKIILSKIGFKWSSLRTYPDIPLQAKRIFYDVKLVLQ